MKREFSALFPDRKFTTKIHDPRLPYRFTDWKYTRGELYCFDRLRPCLLMAHGGRMIVIETFDPGCAPRPPPTIPIGIDSL